MSLHITKENPILDVLEKCAHESIHEGIHMLYHHINSFMFYDMAPFIDLCPVDKREEYLSTDKMDFSEKIKVIFLTGCLVYINDYKKNQQPKEV